MSIIQRLKSWKMKEVIKMAFSFGFYDALEHDRRYDAIQMSQIFDGIILDGVFATVKDAFVVKASEEPNQVIVSSGRAWFDHTWNYNDAPLPIEAPISDLILKRIDALVIDVNRNVESRTNAILWVQGIPSSNPVKPILINEINHHQYPLAYVTRDANMEIIKQENIENAIGTEACPFVTGVLETVDIELLLLQWEDSYKNWFNNLKYILDGDVAGHLLNLIEGQTELLNLALDEMDKRWAGCWIEFTNANKQPTNDPYLHWIKNGVEYAKIYAGSTGTKFKVVPVSNGGTATWNLSDSFTSDEIAKLRPIDFSVGMTGAIAEIQREGTGTGVGQSTTASINVSNRISISGNTLTVTGIRQYAYIYYNGSLVVGQGNVANSGSFLIVWNGTFNGVAP